jgi:hypothetical protein
LVEKLADMKPVLIVFLIIGICFTAKSQSNWIQIPNNNEEVKMFFNPSRSSKVINVTTWMKMEYFNEELDKKRRELGKISGKDYSKFSYSLIQFEFDCRTHRTKLLSQIDYDMDANELNSVVDKYAKWQSVVPDSKAEISYSFVCDYFKR